MALRPICSGVPEFQQNDMPLRATRSGVPEFQQKDMTLRPIRSGVPEFQQNGMPLRATRSGVPEFRQKDMALRPIRSGVPVEWHASESNSFRRSGVPVEWQASHSTLFRRSGVPVEGQTSQKQIVPTFRCSKRITSHPSTLFPGPRKYTSRPAHRSARNVEKEPWRVGPFCAIYVCLLYKVVYLHWLTLHTSVYMVPHTL